MPQLRVALTEQAKSMVPVIAVLLAGLIAVQGFSYGSDRADFAAHYLAGLGGTMLLLSLLLLIKRSQGPCEWSVVGVIMLAAAIGVGCEQFLFVEGGFDLVDVANQSLGAVTAGLIFAVWPVRGVAARLGWILLALGFVAGGAKLVGFI